MQAVAGATSAGTGARTASCVTEGQVTPDRPARQQSASSRSWLRRVHARKPALSQFVAEAATSGCRPEACCGHFCA